MLYGCDSQIPIQTSLNGSKSVRFIQITTCTPQERRFAAHVRNHLIRMCPKIMGGGGLESP